MKRGVGGEIESRPRPRGSQLEGEVPMRSSEARADPRRFARRPIRADARHEAVAIHQQHGFARGPEPGLREGMCLRLLEPAGLALDTNASGLADAERRSIRS